MSTGQSTQEKDYSFDPIGTLGSITGGVTAEYDSAYTGRFVNRDTSVAMERTVYAPRGDALHNSFVVSLLKVYSGDGQAHSNVTIGHVCDWDIPSDNAPNNTSAVSSTGDFVYMQGTDTLNSNACQSNTARFGAEAFGGTWSGNDDPCTMTDTYYGSVALNQLLIEDTSFDRSANPIDPPAPDDQAWFDDISANPDKAGMTKDTDQAIFTTFVFDHELGATDTLYFWSVLTSVRNGTLADLEEQVAYAKSWYKVDRLGCAGTCCVGRVGDANNSGVDEPTIGDISVMIDMLFISGDLVDCMLEADINQSGGTNPVKNDVTIGDISILIDYLFITGKSLGLNDCL
jgi:hypothetical protein